MQHLLCTVFLLVAISGVSVTSASPIPTQSASYSWERRPQLQGHVWQLSPAILEIDVNLQFVAYTHQKASLTLYAVDLEQLDWVDARPMFLPFEIAGQTTTAGLLCKPT
jgi:hypothetical protein